MVATEREDRFERMVDDVTSRMHTRGPADVSHEAVRRIVWSEADALRDARVVDFVAVLVERRASRRLRAGEARAS